MDMYMTVHVNVTHKSEKVETTWGPSGDESRWVMKYIHMVENY